MPCGKRFAKFKAWATAPSGFNSVRREMEPPGDDGGVLGVPKFWPDDMLGLKGGKKKRF